MNLIQFTSLLGASSHTVGVVQLESQFAAVESESLGKNVLLFSSLRRSLILLVRNALSLQRPPASISRVGEREKYSLLSANLKQFSSFAIEIRLLQFSSRNLATTERAQWSSSIRILYWNRPAGIAQLERLKLESQN